MANESFDYEAYKAEMERRIASGMNLKLHSDGFYYFVVDGDPTDGCSELENKHE